jgi:arylsulfatase A-like enzyme
MVASFDNPHNICEWARGQDLPWGNVPDVPTEQCPPLPDNFSVPPYEPEVIRRIQKGHARVYPMVDASPERWRHYRHAYYRLVEKADRGIGRILDALHRTGMADRTLIWFTSDHGDGHGAHQWNQKSLLYEECVRVPLLVSIPGHPRAGVADTRHLVSNGLDLLPTLCDYAEVEPPAGLPGASLRPLLETGGTAGWRDELVVETWPFQGDPSYTPARMLRTARYKYMAYAWGKHREQLIDLECDPGEMVNLAIADDYLPVLHEHRARLRRYCRRTGDEFAPFIPGD